MDPRIRLPEKLLNSFRADSGSAGTAPRPAASVILLREGAEGDEVLLQFRSQSLAFAGGCPAFPGGRVDRRDADPIRSWGGPSVRAWAAELEIEADRARAVIAAAVRETFEESGYLLASHADGTPVTDLASAEWRTDREELTAGGISLAELLDRRELTLRSDWLRWWSVWITPDFEPRRYHTWFFAARCPVEQRVLGVSGEATHERWLTADQALRSADSGEVQLLPPQYCTFLELREAEQVGDVFDASRTPRTYRPELASDSEGTYLALPDDLVELGLRAEHEMYGATQG